MPTGIYPRTEYHNKDWKKMNETNKGGILLYKDIHNRPDTASSRIRGTWLINYWPELEELHYGRKYSFVIFQKVYETKFAKIFPGIKILDICDPDYTDCKIAFMEMVELCDAVTVSTLYLQQAIQGWTKKPVIVIPDRHDLEFFKEKKIHRKKAKEVCWYGYSHNVASLKSIKDLLIDYNIRLSIISEEPVILSDDIKPVEERYTKWELETVNKEIVKSDFVVMPGSRDPNSRFKSDNKTVNAWLLRMPVATCVEEFERFLDPTERQKEADKRYKFAVENYDVKQSVKEMQDLINKLKKEKK